MLAYLKEHPDVVFEPEGLRVLTAAFDTAWRSVQASGARFDTVGQLEAARAVIAKHIIEAAKQGERDQRRLRDGALVAFTQANLRNAPRRTASGK